MKRLLTSIVISGALMGGAWAQAATTSPLPSPQPNVDNVAPLPGANSFSETQVKDRLETSGYTNVADLKKDEQGIWRGSAMFNGAKVPVAVDYRGNIFQK